MDSVEDGLVVVENEEILNLIKVDILSVNFVLDEHQVLDEIVLLDVLEVQYVT